MFNMASAVQAVDLSPIRSNGYSQAYQHGIHNFWFTAHFGLKKATQNLIRGRDRGRYWGSRRFHRPPRSKQKWIQPCFPTANLQRRRREQTGQPRSDGTAHCSQKRGHGKGSCTKRSGLTQPNIRGGDAVACGHIPQAWCHCPDCRCDTTVDRHLWRYAASRCLLSKRRLGNSYDIFLWSGTCHPPWKTGLGIHPLYSAAMFGNTAEAQLLLDHGADV